MLPGSYPPVRPNQVIFEFAVQQARDAAVAFSQGHDVWEDTCHGKLTLTLLLLDWLGSESDGDDLSKITSYTAIISKLLSSIERRRAQRAQPPPLDWGLVMGGNVGVAH